MPTIAGTVRMANAAAGSMSVTLSLLITGVAILILLDKNIKWGLVCAHKHLATLLLNICSQYTPAVYFRTKVQTW